MAFDKTLTRMFKEENSWPISRTIIETHSSDID